MSVTRFKAGDKVRIRGDITGCEDTCRDGVYINEKMAKIAGSIFTIDEVTRYYYSVAENDWGWNDEMLEPAEKTLDCLCAGDDISKGFGVRRVLAVVDGCYLLSNIDKYTVANNWYTAAELKKMGYQVLSPGHSITLIEINGKEYDKSEVEEAIKDLEPIDPSDTDS
jgi:hypothetical protein